MRMILVFAVGMLFAGQVWGGDKEKAGKHFEKGVELFNNGDYEAALVEFEAAYEAHPHYAVRYNLGITLYKLHRYGAAVGQIEKYLVEGGGEGERILADLEDLLGQMVAIREIPDVESSPIRGCSACC